jgi:hypothetical protein
VKGAYHRASPYACRSRRAVRQEENRLDQGQLHTTSKVTYTLSFDHLVDGGTKYTGTVSKVSTYPRNIHKTIYTILPWLERG